jgi:L-ascorbate metabolism protein UlaG (beta-lactamase superfamily)
VSRPDLRLSLTYIGGPTALFEFGGLRLLTDPTFDPAGGDYPTPVSVLHKTQSPARGPDAIGAVDAVLLSHDHHADNLDRAGRDALGAAGLVLPTVAAAERLGGHAVGMVPWQSHDLEAPGGRWLRITATPARHGPADADRGPVVGFALAFADDPEAIVYVSGDTVWYEGVAEVGRRFPPRVAILNLGAARVREVGPYHLTFTAEEAVTAAVAFGDALVVPLHFEGWAHFSESRQDIERAFAAAGLADRLRWPIPGQAIDLSRG